MHFPPQLYTTEWTAGDKPWKKFTKKQNIQFFELSVPAISAASPLHWIIYVVNNNLKKSCLLHLREIHNSNVTYLGFQRLENLAQLLKVVWVKTQDTTVFDKANIIGSSQMKKFGGTVKIKFGAPNIFPNAKAPACNFFRTTTNKLFGMTSVSCYSTSFGRLPRQADTVHFPVQTKQKLQNITPFSAMVESVITIKNHWLESSDSNRRSTPIRA